MPIITDAELASAVMSVIYLPFGVLGIVLNAVCVVSLIRGDLLRKSSAFALIALLCIADILSEITVCESGILRVFSLLTDYKFTRLHCYLLFVATGGISGTLPNATMMCIAAERLYIVVAPLHYHRWGSSFVKLAVGFCATAAVVGTIVGGIGVSESLILPACTLALSMTPGWQENLTVIGRFVPCGLCCCFYVTLIVAFRKYGHRRAAAAITEEQHVEIQRKQRNITAAAVAACAVYVICLALGSLLVSFVGPSVQTSSPAAGIVILQLGGLLNAMNGIANAAIFLIRCDDVRKQTKKDFLWCFCHRGSSSATIVRSLHSTSNENSQTAAPPAPLVEPGAEEIHSITPQPPNGSISASREHSTTGAATALRTSANDGRITETTTNNNPSRSITAVG